MLNTKVIKGLTDLRSDPQVIIQLARDEGPVYIFNRNRPQGVVMDIKEYEELVERLEDALDVAEIREMKKTAKPEDFITHEKLFKDLGIK